MVSKKNNTLFVLRAVYTSCLDMQVSDLYVLDLYDFYVYMACLNLFPVWFYFPPYTLYSLAKFKFCNNYN